MTPWHCNITEIHDRLIYIFYNSNILQLIYMLYEICNTESYNIYIYIIHNLYLYINHIINNPVKYTNSGTYLNSNH